MLEPCSATVGFAAAVVRQDLASAGSSRPSDLTQYVMKRLYPRFSLLFGSAGFDALLGRSLALAQGVPPSLEEVGAGSAVTLVRVDACAHDGALDQDAAIAIVSRLLEVMIELVGEDLTLRILRDAGPRTMEAGTDDDGR